MGKVVNIHCGFGYGTNFYKKYCFPWVQWYASLILMESQVLFIMIDFSTSNTSYIDSVPRLADNHRQWRASLHLASIYRKRNRQAYEFSPEDAQDIQLCGMTWDSFSFRVPADQCRITKSINFSVESSRWPRTHGSCLLRVKQVTWFSKRISDWQLSRGLAYMFISEIEQLNQKSSDF